MENILQNAKKIRRKTLGFYTIQLLICAPAAYTHGITWHLVVLCGATYLVYTGAISAEKTILAWINKK